MNNTEWFHRDKRIKQYLDDPKTREAYQLGLYMGRYEASRNIAIFAFIAFICFIAYFSL